MTGNGGVAGLEGAIRLQTPQDDLVFTMSVFMFGQYIQLVALAYIWVTPA